MTTRFTTFILMLMAAFCTFGITAQDNDEDVLLRDKITNAVMKVYDEQIAKDPSDYNTLFARAHQHYYNGEYTAALADVNQAMLITPKSDKELRFDEYILRARISEARQDYSGELADLYLAQELEPKSLACTDLIAKANLKTGNLNAAEKAFKTILRAESMNYDAMYGLAQVDLARGNNKSAIERMNKAVSLFRVEPQVYVNRADIYARQGDIKSAVEDLLSGMSVGDGGNAVQALFDLSDTHYNSVMTSLAELADNSDNGGVYRYLKANIAMDHSDYRQALNDLNYISRNHLYESPSVDGNIARCCLELARWDEAIMHAEKALNQSPNMPECLVVKAVAEYYTGDGQHFNEAMQTLNQCSAFAPQYVPMLMTKAQLLAGQGKDKDALGYLNAAIANEPENAESRLMRAIILKRLGNDALAHKDLIIITKLSDEDNAHLKGIAYSLLERDNEAFKWLNSISAASVPGGEDFYFAALLMTLRGDQFKAMEYAQKAVNLGFGSLFKLQYDDLSIPNLKPLRNEPGFDLFIEKSLRNFM